MVKSGMGGEEGESKTTLAMLAPMSLCVKGYLAHQEPHPLGTVLYSRLMSMPCCRPTVPGTLARF